MAHVVVMVTTSYPRFPGDTVGTFMEPIAQHVARRGHDVHIVAPWHPLIRHADRDDGVRFHFFKYAPIPQLNVFGYAGGLRADTHLKTAAIAAAPLALAMGWQAVWRVARKVRATVVHGHWVVPGGAIAASAAAGRPVVISLHGSDVFVAERYCLARIAARRALRRAQRITACSEDLRMRAIALGAPADRIDVVPYGVDPSRFRPDASAREATRARLGLAQDDPLLFAVGRLVRKKGFEYLIDATAQLAKRWPRLHLVIAGSGDLQGELRARADSAGIGDRVRLPGVINQHEVPAWLAAADVAVVPSVHDDAGNVDGLPNVVLEALASGTALVATRVGGISSVARDGETALLVAERSPGELAHAVERLLTDAQVRRRIGTAAREEAARERGWDRVAERFEAAYDRAVACRASDGRAKV
jgi:glycosyltransferase involved in cell wall biosynthesis